MLYLLRYNTMPKRANRRFRRRANKKSGRKMRGKGRKTMPNTATSGKGQMARIIETIEFTDLQPNGAVNSVFTLSQFPRASTLAGNFAFYKAAKVTWNYEPLYNTFQDTAGATSVPYLYTLMNRGQINTIPAPGLGNIQACGARPVKLVSRTSISYKPNWCSPGLLSVIKPDGSESGPISAVIQQGVKQNYDWLSCSGQEVRAVDAGGQVVVPSLANVLSAQIGSPVVTPAPPALTLFAPNANNNVVYNGHINFIDQEFDANSAPCCRLTATVVWQFKGALFNQVLQTPVPT